MTRLYPAYLTALLLIAFALPAVAGDDLRGRRVEANLPPTEAELSLPTRVVVLGTSSPVPDPNRTGASIAVIHKGEAYVFDLGAGATQQAIRAREKFDIPSLNPISICCVFFTHLHSDHIADLPILAASAWWRRSERLRAFGPEGLSEVSDGVAGVLHLLLNLCGIERRGAVECDDIDKLHHADTQIMRQAHDLRYLVIVGSGYHRVDFDFGTLTALLAHDLQQLPRVGHHLVEIRPHANVLVGDLGSAVE